MAKKIQQSKKQSVKKPTKGKEIAGRMSNKARKIAKG